MQVLGTGTLLDQTVTPPDANTFVPSLVTLQHFQFTFTADSTTSTLKFTSIGPGNLAADQVVDTVVVTVQSTPTPTPTPTPLRLLLQRQPREEVSPICL